MTDNDRLMEIMLDVHSGLPRQGPGDDESTLRALSLCTELPMRPSVLDVGCGPGMQTIALARSNKIPSGKFRRIKDCPEEIVPE